MKILLIKGSAECARASAHDHGVKLEIVEYKSKWDQCLCYVADETSVDTLNRWYTEGPHSAPFPDGTLLWWTQEREE